MRAALIGAVAVVLAAQPQAGRKPLLKPAWPADPNVGRVVFKISDSGIQTAFDWARRQAVTYAFRGDPVGDWYEAALPGREAFCMRDVAHQATGAQALGLANYTRNMLRRFAENVAESRDWCSYWEINRYNRPAPADYASDARFWYCLPANYDIVDCSWRMYRWTGDRTYVEGPAFLRFYRRTATDYETRWDLTPETVMRRLRKTDPKDNFLFYRGNPSYDERREPFVLGVDLLATQYAAYVALAGIEEARGDSPSSRLYRRRAEAVKELVNRAWWNGDARSFYARLDANHHFEGHEDSALLYRGVVDEGPKLKAALDSLLERIRREPSAQIELQSHYPEILYCYGFPDVAAAQIVDLSRADRARREYPEVSYSVLGALVTGLMGIDPDADSILTVSGLGAIDWAEIANLPVRGNEIGVRHDGGRKTRFTNQKGLAVTWRAGFAGSFATLTADGKRIKAEVERTASDRNISWVKIAVAPGATSTVEAPR
jgi:hypothetical protein